MSVKAKWPRRTVLIRLPHGTSERHRGQRLGTVRQAWQTLSSLAGVDGVQERGRSRSSRTAWPRASATAKITRKELTDETSKTTRPLSWHDLRATGLTWAAVRADDPLKIMSRAGHTDVQTTQIYIRTAEALREGFGDVFPPIPDALLGPESSRMHRRGGYLFGIFERDTGFEPATSSLGSWHSTN